MVGLGIAEPGGADADDGVGAGAGEGVEAGVDVGVERTAGADAEESHIVLVLLTEPTVTVEVERRFVTPPRSPATSELSAATGMREVGGVRRRARISCGTTVVRGVLLCKCMGKSGAILSAESGTLLMPLLELVYSKLRLLTIFSAITLWSP